MHIYMRILMHNLKLGKRRLRAGQRARCRNQMSDRSKGKIALEEHFYLPSFETYGADGSALDGAGKAQNYLPEFFASVQKRLGDDKLRLEDMDKCGIELMILSLTQPGIQGIADRTIAVETAKKMNDDLAQIVAA